MLREIQVNKSERKVYAINDESEIIAVYDCGTSYYSGFNENGEPYSNADDGIYNDEYVYAEVYGTDSDDEVYGFAYINIDPRGRALHGGRDLEPYQPTLKPTLGCFRMYNADVLHLAQMFIQAENEGIKPYVHVVS